MSRARVLLAVLGLGFIVGALAVAAAVDRLMGLGVFVVGAFLLVLPFLGVHDD